MAQLKPEQQFQLLRPRTWKTEAKCHVQPVSLQDLLGDSTQALSGILPPQDDDWALWFDLGAFKDTTLGDVVGTGGRM